jgi:hypothetical protein
MKPGCHVETNIGDITHCQQQKVPCMNPCTLDIQSLQNELRQAGSHNATAPNPSQAIAVKLQSLFLPFFSEKRSAITITLKKTIQQRPYRLKISKKALQLHLLAPEEQLVYYFREEQAPQKNDTLNFKPEKFQAFSEQLLSILQDLKADKTTVEEYLGDKHGTL